MQSNWVLTCICEDRIVDITFDYQQDYRCVWKEEATKEILLVLEKKDIWWIEQGEAIQLERQPLRLHTLYPCMVHQKSAYILCEPQDDGSRIYQVYVLDIHHNYTIGRKNCDIVFDSDFLSETHTFLFYENNQWKIRDNHSKNGIYVNRIRRYECALMFCDCVYIMGMWIVVGDGWIAINNPMQRVFIDKEVCQPYLLSPTKKKSRTKVISQNNIKQVLPSYALATRTLLPPPSKSHKDETPLVYVLGPSITMGLASLSTAMFMMVQAYEQTQSFTQAYPSLIMGISMVMGTILWPFALRRFEHHQEKQKEKRRRDVYLDYIKEVQTDSKSDVSRYKEWKRNLFPKNPIQIPAWQYQTTNMDIVLCLGYGNEIISIPWENDKNRQNLMIEDELEIIMENLKKDTIELQDVPIMISMEKFSVIALHATKECMYPYSQYLLFQLVTTFEPSQLQLVIACSKNEIETHNIRFLPHLLNQGRRFLCHTPQEAKTLCLTLDDIHKPIIIISYLPSCTNIFIPYINSHKHVLLLVFHEVQYALSINVEKATGHFLKQDFFWSRIDPKCFSYICEAMQEQKETTFPTRIGMLHMYQVTTCQQLDIEKRWRNALPDQTLQARVGVYENHEVCYLDVHEKAHGPHGILAGMTGSGKSELLITWLLSLAISYHPHDVSFVLVDYKGGGTAKSLASLPHVAGVITNLDGFMIERSLCALNSELERRQRIFVKTMQDLSLSSMDIYTYQKYRKADIVKEPLPHLMIVFDEFAELKQHQPQFMEQLIRLARIGRSLGIHLVLATQKPSGVVDDQIWSNAHFHICLKVAEKSDSFDMLKRAEGAMLSTSGRFYLQVGYNEVFEEGQAAYANMPYQENGKKKEAWIHHINHQNDEIETWQRDVSSDTHRSELQAITGHIQEIARLRNIKPIVLWLPMLTPITIKKKAEMGVYAIVDDPVHQRQYPLRITTQDSEHTLFYASNAKESQAAIETILYALMTQCNADEIGIAIMDMEDGSLSKFQAYPQVFCCIKEEDCDDVKYVIHWLSMQLKQRKKGRVRKCLYLVLHHYIVFHERYEELEDELYQVIRDGARYGIYVFLTTPSPHDLRYRYQSSFPQNFCFHLIDSTSMYDVLGVQKHIPTCFKRALWKQQDIYEVQFVTYATSTLPYVKRNQKNQERMPSLPQHMYWKAHGMEANLHNGIPIGMNKKSRSLLYVPPKSAWMLSGTKANTFLQSLKQHCKDINVSLTILFANEASLFSLSEAQGICFILVPTSMISTYMVQDWFLSLQSQGNFLWIGQGLKDTRYVLNLQLELQDVQGMDGFRIYEQCDEIRFMEDE